MSHPDASVVSSREAVAIPRRHGIDPVNAARVAGPVLRFFIRDKQAAQPSAEQWQRLGQAYQVGDPPADALVQWMQAHGMAQARAMFEQALAQGIEAVHQAPQPLRDFFAHVEQAPAWLDRERLTRGVQASYLSGLTGMRILRDLGLMAGYQAGAINKTLVMTGALEKGVARRIAETTKWRHDCAQPGGMDRFGEGFKNTLRVRMIHALVRRHVAASPKWDASELGLPINQVDMQATYLGFSTVYLMGQRVMGVILKQQEAEDIMHLWRYIGWVMGVQDQWLCETEQDSRIALYQNLLSQAPADDSSSQLGRALMDEPLARHYPKWRRLRGLWNKEVHLSIVRLFVGRQGMRDLGLPARVMPWYPVVFAPLNFVWCGVNRLLPGGLARLRDIGQAAQFEQLAIMFGAERPEILAMSGVKTITPAR